MDNTKPQTLKILFVNIGSQPISLEKVEVPLLDRESNMKVILDGLNRIGKQCHALLKIGNRLYVCDHKARKGPSDDYYRHEVKYHPYAGELA
jgi:hypothetical protein